MASRFAARGEALIRSVTVSAVNGMVGGELGRPEDRSESRPLTVDVSLIITVIDTEEMKTSQKH